MKRVYLNNIEFYLPKQKESNIKFFKKNKKLFEKIGVKNRRVVKKNVYSNDLAIKSSQKVIRKVNKEKIDFLIFCTQTGKFNIPTNACILHDKLRLKKGTGAYDINLGCSAYPYLLSIAKSLIVSKQAKNILLVTSDTYSKFIRKSDLATRLIFSDGSTASLVSESKSKDSFEILDFGFGTDGSGYKEFIIEKKNSNFIKMNGPKIYEFTLKKIPDSINKFLKKNRVNKKKIDYFFFHQASKIVVESLKRKLDLPNDKVILDMEQTGNTVSSTIPLALKRNHKILKKGSLILLAGFGVGLSWGIALIKKT